MADIRTLCYYICMKEEWKEIPGYEGLYEASSLGRIRSMDKTIKTYNGGSYIRAGMEKKPCVNKSGYFRLNLCKDGISKSCLVHRLVAKAFIPNGSNLPEVNHINENKLDNRIENLEWCSYQYNMNWGYHNENVGRTNGKPVVQFTIEETKVKEYYSSYEASRMTGITEQSINLCCLGRRQHAGGFRWKYANDNTPFTSYRPRESAVVQYKNGNIVGRFRSIEEARSVTNINNISACCRSMIKTAGGYNWCYEK